MEKYKTVRLGDVCEIVMGTSPEGKTISQDSSAGIEFHQGKTCFGNLYLNESGMFTNSPIRFADAGNVIMSVRAPVGDSNITPRKIAIGRGLCTFNTKNNFEKLFLYYYLKSQIDFLRLQSTGSTFKAVNKDVISDLQIPLPPLQEQKHIATVLDKCTELITKNEQLLEKYDTLIKSRFIEMFGNPITNPKRWEVKSLNEVCRKITDGKHGGCQLDDKSDYYYVGAREIFDLNIHYETAQKIKKEDFEKDYKRCNLEIGDFCIVNTGATIGKTAIAKDERTSHTLLQKSVALLKVKPEEIIPLYLQYSYITNESMYKVESASAQPNLLLSKIRETKLMIPPLSLQNDFAAFVQQVDKSKFAVQKSLEKAETLYKSLMQEYFG